MNSSTSTSERGASARRPTPRAGFAIVLVIGALFGAGLASLASAFGSAAIAPQLGFAALGRADVVLFGNSVNRTRSHCDSDLRDLGSMLQDELRQAKRKVRDVSSGGMHSAEHVAQARLLVARRAARALVLPAVPGSIDEAGAGDRSDRTRVFAYLTLAFATPAELIAALRAPPEASSRVATVDDPQRFGPRRDALMQAEKNAEACPEQPARDREFMRYMYRRKIASLPREVVLPPALAALSREAAAAGVELVLFAPPFAMELLRSEGMHEELAHAEAYAASLARAASALPLRFVDLHALVPASAFTDAWCACGHLDQDGRAAVARALAAQLSK
jgi:hypothetical protein